MIKNRQIKFRVWDTESKEWIKNLVSFSSYFDIINGTWGCWDSYYKGLTNNFILQQFTGFLDADGKEIYEGDIINWTIYNAIGKVIYNNVTGGFYWTGSEVELWQIDKNEILVVGNIFENPELLKNENKLKILS